MSFDFVDFYHNESRLFGVDTLNRDLTAWRSFWMRRPRGSLPELPRAPIEKTCGLGETQEAYRKVAAGAAGCVVLRPQESGGSYDRLSRLVRNEPRR